jgi:hypothetical protein
MFEFDDPDGISGFIQAAYSAWKSGVAVHGATPVQASRYSRRDQARRLSEMLAGLGEGKG